MVFLLAFLVFVSFSSVTGANPINIDNSTSDGGIKNAVDNLDNNGTLFLDNGIYSGVNNTNILINKNVTIVGKDKQSTIIDGSGISRIFNITSGNSLTLINLTIRNCKSDIGGSIYSQGSLTLENCIFTNNSAVYNIDNPISGYGGAIAIFGNVDNVNIINSTFDSNNATGLGGVFYFDGKVNGINIANSNFYNNYGALGGGLYINNTFNGNLRITNSTFRGNNASGPGGAICFNNEVNGSVIIINSSFNNHSSFGIGGCYLFYE